MKAQAGREQYADHDEKTEPVTFVLLTTQQLDLLALRAKEHTGAYVEAGELAELVRLYRGVSSVGESMQQIGQIAESLEVQVRTMDMVADAVLRGAAARFEILLCWRRTLGGVPIDSIGWHETKTRMRWSGTYEEAAQIVRDNYGPKRGTDAHIVVRVDQ